MNLRPLCLAFALAAPVSAAAQPAPLLSGQEPIPLVSGKAITPQGRQVNVGSFPANMALTPDGRHLVVSNIGFRQFLTVIRVADGVVTSRLKVGEARSTNKEGLYYGLAFAPTRRGDDTALYASRGAEDKVAVYRLDILGRLLDVKLALNNPVPAGRKLPHHVAGVAVNEDGTRVYAVNNQTGRDSDMKGSLSILDAVANKPIATIPLPGFPLDVAAVTRGQNADRKVYVSSERDGVVAVVDPQAKQVARTIATGSNPTALLLDRYQRRLYVANSGSDTLSIVDTTNDRILRTVLLRPDDVRGLPGFSPLGMAISPDEARLYVAMADMNAVAVVGLPEGKLLGYIPVGWYPTSVAVSPDGRKLFVANAKGVRERNPNADKRYTLDILEGTVSIIDTPSAEALRPMTAQTLVNNRVAFAARRAAAKFKNPGIKHVIYIIKENRTYDQVFGDMPRGKGDPSLCMFPRPVTPNQHALAERFVLLDNFYDCAEVSADGWNWSTSGMANPYVARNAPYNYSGRGRSYDFEGQNNGVPVDLLGFKDVATAAGGYIWDAVIKKGLSYRNYGFFVNFDDPATRSKEGERTGAPENVPNKKALQGRTDTNFRLYDTNYPDSDAYRLYSLTYPGMTPPYGKFAAPSRFAAWKREFDEYVSRGDMPRFMTIRMGNDHTNGTRPGSPSPRAMVADNDFAVGQVVEAVSKSPFWKSTAIFILEDDAQNGFDHVDAHRSIAAVISPYTKRGSLDSRFYNTDSMLHTICLLLGVPPMNQYVAAAPPMDVFGAAPENIEPYTAALPAREIMAEINGRTAYRAEDSLKLNFADADAVPDQELNDILWHALMPGKPKPPIRYGLRIFPKPPKDDDDD